MISSISLLSGETCLDGSSVVQLRRTCTAVGEIAETQQQQPKKASRKKFLSRVKTKFGNETKMIPVTLYEEKNTDDLSKQLLRAESTSTEGVTANDESSTSSFSSYICSSISNPIEDLAEAFDTVLNQDKSDLSVSALVVATRLFEDNLRNAGLHQSAADLHQNLKKVQTLLDIIKLDPDCQNKDSLRQVLLYEKQVLKLHSCHQTSTATAPLANASQKSKKDTRTYTSLARQNDQIQLQDKSGAVGLLWIRRSLQFNQNVYARVYKDHHGTDLINISYGSGGKGKLTPRDATLEAYHTVLRPYHSWLLRHIFVLGIRALSPVCLVDFLAAVGGFMHGDDVDYKANVAKQEETLQAFGHLLNVWDPVLSKWQEIFEELGMEDRRKV